MEAPVFRSAYPADQHLPIAASPCTLIRTGQFECYALQSFFKSYALTLTTPRRLAMLRLRAIVGILCLTSALTLPQQPAQATLTTQAPDRTAVLILGAGSPQISADRS